MSKKVIKKKKIRIIPLIILLLIVVTLFAVSDIYLNTKIKNITIKGTSYLKDDYLLSLAEVIDYPGFFKKTSFGIKKKLESSPYVKKAIVRKKFYHVLDIKIEEKRPLFFDDLNKQIVFDDESKTKEDNLYEFRIPRLLNSISSKKKLKKFINRMNRLDDDILGKISEIEYVPNDYDKDRFLLSMDDGNSVYLTLTKFEMINYYDDVLTQLEGKKGILYLDSGNHFKIME